MLWSRSASIQMIGTSSGICSTANCLTAVRLMIFVRSAHAKPSSAIAQLTVTSDGPKSCSAIRVARRNPASVFSWPTTEYWTMPVVRSLITYSQPSTAVARSHFDAKLAQYPANQKVTKMAAPRMAALVDPRIGPSERTRKPMKVGTKAGL